MPIGKNSIKRVSNNGYSAVKSIAPDMENSVVIFSDEKKSEEIKPTPVSSKKPAAKKPAAKKPAEKKPAAKASTTAAAKKTEPKAKPVSAKSSAMGASSAIPRAVETAKAIVQDSGKTKSYYNIGDDMPAFLL